MFVSNRGRGVVRLLLMTELVQSKSEWDKRDWSLAVWGVLARERVK